MVNTEDIRDAAAALLFLSSCPPSNPPEEVSASVVTTMETPAVSLPPWGSRSRRSRYQCKSNREQEERESPLQAETVVACSRPSPATPHDFAAASDPSTSGSEGFPSSFEIPPVNHLRACDALTKVSALEQSWLLGAAVTYPQSIRRQGRKKTISELQAQERSLVEEKTMLLKLIESKRIEIEVLFEENRRLKRERISSAPAVAKVAKPTFLLPDLNEPMLELGCTD